MKTIDILLYKLLNSWSHWSEHEDYYLNELLPKLKKDFKFASSTEKEMLQMIKNISSKKDWEDLEKRAAKIWSTRICDKDIMFHLIRLIKDLKLEEADDYYKFLQDYYSYLIININLNELKHNILTKIIIKLLNNNKTNEADKKYKKIQDYTTDIIPQNEYDHFKLNYLLSVLAKRISSSMNKFDFVKSDKIYFAEFKSLIPVGKYEKMKAKYVMKYNKQQQIAKNIISNLLREYRFKEADEHYEKNTIYIKKGEFNTLKKQFKLRFELHKILNKFNFLKADNIYLKKFRRNIPIGEYEKIKAEYVKKYFKNLYPKELPPDKEQSEAIGAIGQNILVSARAGSGKTHTISGKVSLLINKYGFLKDQIMVLCFNNDAAENMKSKINKFVGDFENARTFHSFAHTIVKPSRDSILFDKEGEFQPKLYSNYVKNLIKNKIDKYPEFKIKIFNFFHEDYETLDDNKSDTLKFNCSEDRFLYLRNLTEVSLSGNYVKSRGEKWIADFLFEHGIEFYYEQRIDSIDGIPYHPDFTIKYNGRKYILEHWGIDEFSGDKTVPEFWTKSWEEYREEMNKKRNFFKYRKQNLIETSIRDINYKLEIKEQRKDFENKLNNILLQHDIRCIKLPFNELIDKAVKNNLINILNTNISSFISWMQKLEWDAKELIKQLNQGNYSQRQKSFAEIGLQIYNEYMKYLNGKIDFNILISKAIKKLIMVIMTYQTINTY